MDDYDRGVSDQALRIKVSQCWGNVAEALLNGDSHG
jgi:hypothetical protein